MTHAIPVGPTVQVATRSGVQSVSLAPAPGNVLVGVVPLGGRRLVGQDEQTHEIAPGRIPFSTAIEAPTQKIAELASFIPEMRKYHHHTYGSIVGTGSIQSRRSWGHRPSERKGHRDGGHAHRPHGYAQN